MPDRAEGHPNNFYFSLGDLFHFTVSTLNIFYGSVFR